MKPSQIVALVAGVLLVFAVGAGTGIWFTKNFQIVRIDTPEAVAPAVAAPAEVVQEQVVETPLANTAPKGPFSYQFTQNENLRYTMKARVEGTGTEGFSPEDVNLFMSADMNLTTQAVDDSGNADIRFSFDRVDMAGTFMGFPVEMSKSPERTRMSVDQGQPLDTDQGSPTSGIPQLEFFDTPIDMKVGPDGRVLSVRGGTGFEGMISPDALVAPIEFPDPEMAPGYSWTTEYDMPVPGLGTAAKTKAVNTFRGYEEIGGRRLAVIDQEMSSRQYGGTMNSPESIFGEGMGFTVPTFEVRGNNTIYFDVEKGQLVKTDMNVDFDLELGEQMQAIAGLLGAYGNLLNEVEGGQGNRPSPEEPKKSLLDLGLNIKASMELVDEAADAADGTG
jgi:hypothetical protein